MVFVHVFFLFFFFGFGWFVLFFGCFFCCLGALFGVLEIDRKIIYRKGLFFGCEIVGMRSDPVVGPQMHCAHAACLSELIRRNFESLRNQDMFQTIAHVGLTSDNIAYQTRQSNQS